MRRASFACHSTIKSELKTGFATNPNFGSPTSQQASPQKKCPHNNNLSLGSVLLLVALLTVPTATAAVEIPCMPTFGVESYTSYTLTNCNLPNGVNPFVVLTPASLGSSLIANITIDVVGGNVLPCLAIASRERVENIAVSIRGAVVGPHVNRSSIVNELYRAVFSVTRVSVVTNVSITVENSMINVTMAPLLQGNVGALVFVAYDANVYGARVLIQNSSITFACTGQIPFHNTAVLVQVAVAQTLFDLNVTVVASSVDLDVNATALTAAMDLKASMVAAYCIAAVCNAAAITVSTRGPSSLATYLVASGGVANASGVVLGNLVRVSIVYMVVSELRDVSIRWDVGTKTTAVARCTQVCERAVFGYLTAYGVYIGSPRAGNVSLCTDGVSFAIEAPETAIAFRFDGIDVLDGVLVVVHFSNATFLARGLDVGSSPRQTAMVQVDAVTAQDVVVVLEAVQMVSRAVSGGCKSVTVSLVRLAGARSINSHIRIHRSFLVVAVVNGTAPVVSLIVGLFTTITALVHFAPGSGSMTVANVTIEMINSTVAAEHSTNLPVGAPLLLVASLIAALISMSSMLDTHIHMFNVHVQRSFPVTAGPASWFPATFAGSRLNATCLVSFVDLLSMMASEGELLLLVASFVGAPATTTHTNVTTVLTSNSVGYDAELAPILPDEVGVVILPAVLNVSRISIDRAVLFPERQDAAFGFCMSSVGAVRALNSTVEVSTIPNAIATLISVVRGNLTLAQCTTITLSRVSVRAQRLPNPALAAPLTPFTSGDGAIIFDSSTCTAPPPPLRLTQSYVNGFAQLVDPLKFRVPQQQGASVVLLALGCNLWDGAPLPPGSIGLDAALRPLVSYPRSAFNDTLACDGFLGLNHTPEASHSVQPGDDMPPPVAPSLVSATSNIATAVLVYATLLPAANSVGRGAIPGLQRATAVRRLAARCVAQSQFEGDASADRQPPMLSQLMDNPLRLTISVDSDTLSYAAGAAVGNMLLVCVVAAVLHALHDAQLRWASSPQYRQLPAPAVVLRFLPSCPAPSAPAGTFSRLLQPAVGACVVLLASSERSATSIACGAAMLVLWAVYPAYCIVMVAWRGRRDGVFILASHAARKKPRRNRIDNLMVRTLQHAVWYATTATRQWAPHAGSKHRGTPVHQHAQFLLREMGAVFDAFVQRREWYFVVEWGIAGLSGAVLGAAEASAVNDDACAAVLWGGGCAVGLGSAQLFLCIWLRPYSMRLELWMAVVLGCLELLSNALSLADQLDSADMAVTAAVLVEIVVAVIVFAIAVDLRLTSTKESSVSHPIADRTRRSRTSTREMALRELILLICSSM